MKAQRNRLYLFLVLFLLVYNKQIEANLANLTSNDPYPLFSSIFPYSYLTDRQKSQLMQFEYAYPVSRFRINATGYRQSANFGRNRQRDAVNLGDVPNGRWNMLSFFWDPVLRQQLFSALNIKFTPEALMTDCNPPMDQFCGPITDTADSCFCILTQPEKSDPNKEFGFFTIPMLYRKYGVRFESELILFDSCYYAIGIRAQGGVANITQRVLGFVDLTCQALGTACPIASPGIINTPPTPVAQMPPAVAVPYVNQATNPIPPCPAQTPCVPVGPTTPIDCVELPQTFTPCDTGTLCFSYDAPVKKLVTENVMKKKNIITDFFGLNINSFDKVDLEDFRMILFWRQIFVINEEDEFYPRLIFMPWAEAGAVLPLGKQRNLSKPFSLPTGNNDHVSTGLTAGFTLGYLDTIDLNFSAGFTRFFEREYCGYRLPTHPKESGIFPYTADVNIRPGSTWQFGASMNAYRFLGNLSFWAEYEIVQHRHDEIEVCRSFIPSTSKYFKQGFLVELAEDLTKWEVQMFSMAFNYDLSPYLTAGVLWQAPVKTRNAYRSGTFLGTISFVY